MRLKVYAFFDKKVGMHSVPMFFAHEGYFMRAAQSIASDLQTSVGQHPNDFDMHYLGEFDDNTGVFHQDVGIRSLGSCVSLLANRADTVPFSFDEAAQ